MKPLLLLDLDSTLFKTTDFWNDFSVVFAQLSGQPAGKYINHYLDIATGEGRLKTIDYSTLLANAHVTAESVRVAMQKQATNNYIFDDARTLIKKLPQIQNIYDIAILTFGQPLFQTLKIEHAPEIADIPVYITQQLKNAFIKQHFMDRPHGVLVDDKFGQELPLGWLEIHIDRTAKSYEAPERKGDDIVRITNLGDVVDCINLH